jgi:hypothetical protein
MAAPFVSPPERRGLLKMANSRSARSEDGRRARIVLDLGRGRSLRAISGRERCSVNTVRLWRDRFREDRWLDSTAGLAAVSPPWAARSSKHGLSTGGCTASPTREPPTGAPALWPESGNDPDARLAGLARRGLQPHRLRAVFGHQRLSARRYYKNPAPPPGENGSDQRTQCLLQMTGRFACRSSPFKCTCYDVPNCAAGNHCLPIVLVRSLNGSGVAAR